jgi:hypothetical protein
MKLDREGLAGESGTAVIMLQSGGGKKKPQVEPLMAREATCSS